MCVIGIQVFSLSLMYIILPSRVNSMHLQSPPSLTWYHSLSPNHGCWIAGTPYLLVGEGEIERDKMDTFYSYKQRGHLVKVRSGTTRRWSSGERLKEWTIKWCLQEVHNARGHCHCPSQGNGTWFSPKDSPAKNGSHDNASRRLQCSRTGLEELSCR